MTRFLQILGVIATYRTLLLPSIMGVITSFAALLNWKMDTGKVGNVINSVLGLATVASVVVGAIMDKTNANVQGQIQNTADQTSAALTQVSNTVNVINPSVVTKDAIAPPLPTPVVVDPKAPQDKP